MIHYPSINSHAVLENQISVAKEPLKAEGSGHQFGRKINLRTMPQQQNVGRKWEELNDEERPWLVQI